MVWIKAIYTIPNTMHLFYIFSDYLDIGLVTYGNTKRRKYFERAIHKKNGKKISQKLISKVKYISELDFLFSMRQLKNDKIENPDYSFLDPNNLELFCMNIIKPEQPANESDSFKELNIIPDKDVIEIFL